MCALGKLVLFPKEGHTDLPKLVMTSILGLRILVNSYISFFLSSAYFLGISYSSSPLPLGIHPLDENYYATEVIKCKDGSNSFTRDRLNDDFCDCVDGTDEPGTSACPAGKFYCRNVGSTPRFLFSSRVNDHICDCCDGSDENDDSFTCPNKCIMGGNIAYQSSNYGSVVSKPRKNRLDGEDSVEKLQGLKVVTIVQVVLVTVVLAFCLFRRRAKSRRRLSR